MEYLLKSSAILVLFFLFYQIFLKQETFFKSIRIYFITGIISAIAIPLIVIHKYVIKPSFVIPTEFNIENITTAANNNNINWLNMITIAYFIGVVFFIIRFSAQLSSLVWLIFTQKKERSEGYILIDTNKNISPFSFFKYIVYNSSKFSQEELQQILTHEKVHADQYHSLDILASHLMVIMQWFNPFIWLYHQEIQKNLEFIADDHANNLFQEKKKYQYLLLKIISTKPSPILSSNFYNSLIKKRIHMLQKNRSKQSMQLKFIFIIPILIAFITTFNTKIIAQHTVVKVEKIQSDVHIEIINKNFKKADFESLKEKLSKNGISFKYSNLKYNADNEIIEISISLKNKFGNESNLTQKNNIPIGAMIKYNTTTGELLVGNISEDIVLGKFSTSKIQSDNEQTTTKVWVTKTGDSINKKDLKLITVNGFKVDESNSNEKSIIVFDRSSNEKPLIYIDGKELENKNLEDIDATHIEKMDVLTGERALDVYGTKGKNGVIMITSKQNQTVNINEPLVILDGKELEQKKLTDIDPETIESINVLKGEKATEVYGEKGKNGVIEITSKKK